MLCVILFVGFDVCLSLVLLICYGCQVIMNMWFSFEIVEIWVDGMLICVVYLFFVGGDEYEFCIVFVLVVWVYIKLLICFGYLIFFLIIKINWIVLVCICEWNMFGECLVCFVGFQLDFDMFGKWFWCGRDYYGKFVWWWKEIDQYGD